MDTGYPALIAEPLHNPHVTKPSTTPSPGDPENPQDTLTQAESTGSPPTIEKTP